ncbi:MAG: glycosyltransferase family 4 protein [Ignavibacteriaceae bacterium]
MRKLKILQIATQVPFPPTDGGKLSVFGLIENLSANGHEIDFVCYRNHADYTSSIDALRPYCNPYILDVQTDNNVIKAVFNLYSEIPYNASKYYSDKMIDCVSKLLRNKSYDIIQVNHLHIGWLSKQIRKLTDIPLVMRSQNIETIIMKRFSEQVKNPLLKYYSLLQYRKLLKYEPLMYSGFDKCILISDSDLKLLKEIQPQINAAAIPSGIREELLNYGRGENIPFSIAHIGHTDWYPNYDSLNWFLNEIFPEVIKKFPLATLYVFGGGNTKNFPVPKFVKNNVKVIGFVEDLWKELSRIQVTVVPLRIGGGIRIKILELLATGNLVVTTSVGKEGIDVENGKHVLIAENPVDFVEHLTRIFEGVNMNDIIGEGRKFITNNYTWEKITKRFEEEYYKLLPKESR